MVSKAPFANAIRPPNDDFKRLQDGNFGGWRLSLNGLVARPASLSLSDLKGFPVRSQITEVACEEGWSSNAEWIRTPPASCRKRDLSFTTPSIAIGGRALTWPMHCVLRLS